MLRAVARVPAVRANGAVDGPAEATPGTTPVWGWAYRRHDPVVAVVVLVNGSPAALATLGEPRPDVAAVRAGGERAGWTANVDLRGHAGPRVVFSALALTRAGLSESLDPLSARLTSREHTGAIVRPPDGAVVAVVDADVVPIEGWALPESPVARVEVRVNGSYAGLARPLAHPTPNLADIETSPTAALAGFTHVIDLSGCEVGQRITIEAEIVALDGTVFAIDAREVVVRETSTGSPVTAAPVAQARDRVIEVVKAARDPGDGLHLAVFTHQLDLGGGQLYMFELLRHLLVELDVSCIVVSQTDGVLRAALEDLGAFVHVAGRPPTKSPALYEAAMLELAEVVGRHGCNAAFVNTMSAAQGADIAHRLGLPTVWAVHESYRLAEFFFAAYGEHGLHPYIRARYTDALRDTAVVVFEAEATRRLYEPHGDPRRLVTIPYGIPLVEIDDYLATCNRAALRSSHGFDEHTTVVLSMGTYEPRKGQGALALAFAELAETFPNAILVLIGDTGNFYARGVRELVDRLDLGDRIRLLPVVEDTYAWYAMADALVTISDVESLPRSVLEVMAFGVPVLAAAVFGVPELVEDGITGLLCEPRDVESTISGLHRILGATPEERSVLGAGGRDRVRARYDSSGYAAAYRQLLRGLIDEPRALPSELLVR